MARTLFSLLLLRRLSSHNRKPYLRLNVLSPSISRGSAIKPFSTTHPVPSSDPKPSSLSARMSFVFEQIDAIENERSQKDQTLQRIRAWRQSKNPNQNAEFGSGEVDTNPVSTSTESSPTKSQEFVGLDVREKLEVEMVHPWPEWIELMERLVHQNYFDHRRKNEDKMVQDLGFDVNGVAEEGLDFTKDFKTVQTACLNLGKDRFDIFRSLSRQDIQTMVGYGCPSTDKKVVFSAKLLRKHAHLDEGDVCSSCSLRSSCERAYLVTNKEDEARTIDVMRVLLTFGFDPINGSVVNKSLMKQKSVKTVVRKLLHEVVKLSAVPIDPNLPPPVIRKPPPKVKQPPPPPKKRVGRDDIEMKKGDWLCSKCDFMNFAKNTVCLQCDAKRPQRQLLPGEWECPQCNFLNYRRNMACFHCECKRPPDQFVENRSQERQQGPRTRFEKVAPEVSNAWNFDFDDDESDGADVAAFEQADSSVRAADSSFNNQAQEGDFRRSEDNLNKTGSYPRVPDREYFEQSTNRTGTGFDDFDDEDDVESYELEAQNSNPKSSASSIDFSEVECFSELEDNDDAEDNFRDRRRTSSQSYNKSSMSFHSQRAYSGSKDDKLDFDSDEDLSVHPKWKSSHVADSTQRNRVRGPTPSRRLSFGSDDELGLHSDSNIELDKEFGSRKNGYKKSERGRWSSSRRDINTRGGNSDSEDGPDFGSKHDNRNNLRSYRGKSRFGDREAGGRGNNSRGGRGSNMRNSFRDDFSRSSGNNRGGFDRGDNDFKGNRRKTFSDDFDGSSSRGNNRRPNDGFSGQSRGNNRRSREGFNSFSGNDRGFRRDDRGPQSRNDKGNRGGRYNDYNRDMDGGGEVRRKRVIER